MDAVFGRILLVIFALWLILQCGASYAKESQFRLLDVDRLSFEYAEIADHRDFFYTEDQDDLKYGMAFLIDLRLAKYLYWTNSVHMMGTEAQVRAVGWEFEQSANLGKYVDLFYYHHSQHVLERERGTRGYPLENRYGVRIHFIKK